MTDLDRIESHISWLLFTEDHVLKVKKPVTFGFLDLSTVEARFEACRREVELNRRLAPDVYEGLGTFTYPDGRREPVVVMRRLPSERRLSALIAVRRSRRRRPPRANRPPAGRVPCRRHQERPY